MPYYCSVPRCTSMAGKAKNVSFHQFPRDEELAKLWNEILKRGKPYTKYSKVCSLHFKPEDYTMTSNKGQWKTLRKDVVPSQNLPSDIPLPYQRKQSEPWLPNVTPALSMIDPVIHQQVAQAIYMQTMLAIQAAGATNSANNESGSEDSQLPEDLVKPGTPDIQNIHKPPNSYKCNHCTKCFKDPDVFQLHQRIHKESNIQGYEKENFSNNTTLTLQANPILANLLKNNMKNIEKNDIQSSFLSELGSKMEQYIKLSVLANEDNMVSDHVHSNSVVISDKLMVQQEESKTSHKHVINNQNIKKKLIDNNFSGFNNDVSGKENLTSGNYYHMSIHKDNVLNIDNSINHSVMTNDFKKDSVVDDCVISNNLFSDVLSNDYKSLPKSNYRKDVIDTGDNINDRMQRLAMLANSNYSLISNDVERANLIFGNGKIIEGVIDFKLNGDNKINSDSAAADVSERDLNESIESDKLVIDETV